MNDRGGEAKMNRRTSKIELLSMALVLVLILLAFWQAIGAHNLQVSQTERYIAKQTDSFGKMVETAYQLFEADAKYLSASGILSNIITSKEINGNNQLMWFLKSHTYMIDEIRFWHVGYEGVWSINAQDLWPYQNRSDALLVEAVSLKSYRLTEQGVVILRLPINDLTGDSVGGFEIVVNLEGLMRHYSSQFYFGEETYTWYETNKGEVVYLLDRKLSGNSFPKFEVPKPIKDKVAIGLSGVVRHESTYHESTYKLMSGFYPLHMAGTVIPVGVSFPEDNIILPLDRKLFFTMSLFFVVFICLIAFFRYVIRIEMDTKRSIITTGESFKKLIESIPAGILLANKKGEVTYINRAAKRMTDHYSEKEMLISDVFVMQQIGNLQQNFIKCHEQLHPIALVIEHVEIGNEKSAVYSFMDISQIEQARVLAEASNRSKTEFLANISHEIKTPMNGIIASASILKESLSDSEESELVDLILNSSTSLLEIINQILEHSKIESGKLNLEMKPFNVRSQMESTVETFNSRALKKGNCLVLDMHPNVPQNLVGDQVRIQQILNNVIGNAIKFTDNGFVWVDVAYKKKNNLMGELIIQVGDTGSGIPKEKQNIIYEPFVQIDGSLTRNHGGTGLGLAIVKDLLDMMRGSILMESPNPMDAKRRGTLFKVQIPIEHQNDFKENELYKENELPSIAIIGQNDLILKSVVHGLEYIGIQGICVNNQDQLIDLFSKSQMGIAPPVIGYIQLSGENEVLERQILDLLYTLDRRQNEPLHLQHVIQLQLACEEFKKVVTDYHVVQVKYPIKSEQLLLEVKRLKEAAYLS